jgi:small subunit ribosomal protein S9
VVNNKDYKEYFPTVVLQDAVVKPLETTDFVGKFDVKVVVSGGGVNGQAEAVKLGIARALVKMDGEQRPILKTLNLLRRDPRQVERKKPGQPKARKKFQFSKR